MGALVEKDLHLAAAAEGRNRDAVANRIYLTYLVLNDKPMPTHMGLRGAVNRAFFWTDERTSVPYDIWVIAILAFVWLTPPDWLADPTASGTGLIGLLAGALGAN